MTTQIPMLDLGLQYDYMKKDIDAAISACLAHQQWIFGPEVKEIEGRIASYLGSSNCIGASSGTEALVLALRAIAIKTKGREYFDREDLIITTPLTFTATGDAILRAGATPVFVDIDTDTYNISPQKIKECLDSYKGKFAGIIPVHLYGQTCDMDSIMSIANEHGLFVLEDVAQAFGAEWKGKKAGSIGTAGAFSFFPSKNLGGFGDGGMVSTNDAELTSIIRMLIKHGGKDKYNVDHIGYNARLDTLQAAVVLAKLKYIDEFNGKRRQIANAYDSGLSCLDWLVTPKTIEGAMHVYHQYTIRVKGREAIQERLKKLGISTMVYYPHPLHKMKVFDGRCVSMPVSEAESACQEVLSLPIEPLFDTQTVQAVIGALKDAGN